MKIAFISDAIYPYNKGGKEKKIFEISTRLVKKGHEVHIYTMKWWTENTQQRIENGVFLHAISPLYPLYSGKRRSFKEAIFFSLHCFVLIKEDFDVIDVDHMPHLVIFPLKIICMLKRKTLFVSWHEVWGRDYWKKYIGKMGLPAYYIEKLSVALPDRILSNSGLTTRKLKEEFNRIDNVFTVNMGIHYNEIAAVKPSIKSSDVIFAGRLLENKNVDLLVLAIAEVKKVYPFIHCIIVGEGPEKEHIQKLIIEYKLGKNITLFNFLPNHQDLYALFKASKIFAFPSTREGFGIVVLEANACGLPVIVIDHVDNASKNLIKKTNGVVIPLDMLALAAAIVQLLQSKISRVAIATSVKDYDWNLIVGNTLGVYQL